MPLDNASLFTYVTMYLVFLPNLSQMCSVSLESKLELIHSFLMAYDQILKQLVVA